MNNVNRRFSNLSAWLQQAAPDSVCLQELKATDAAFPAAALEKLGYRAVLQGQRSWNGVAILAKGLEPVLTQRRLPGDVADGQARYIEAAVQGVLVGCIYLPNGNPQPGPKFDYKLAWFERLITHAADLLAANLPVILAEDFNVVPTDADIYSIKSWKNDAPCNRRRARLSDACWIRAGWMLSAPNIRPNRCTRSGITSANAGCGMLASALTICCLVPRWPDASGMPALTERCAAQKARAIMPRLGFRWRHPGAAAPADIDHSFVTFDQAGGSLNSHKTRD